MASPDELGLLEEAEGFGGAVDLGPVILEGKGTSQNVVLAVLFGLLLVPFGVGLALIHPRNGEVHPLQFGAGGAVGLFGLGLLIYAIASRWLDRDWRVTIRERGAVERRRGVEIAIPFDAVDELEYKNTRVYVNGAYTATNDHLRLRSGGRMILFLRKRDERKFFKTGVAEPNPLDPVSDRVSARIASKMAERLDSGESVPWTGGLVIHPDGLELAGKKPARYTWAEVDRVSLDNGVFQLWAGGQSRPRSTIQNGAANFHPGYRLLTAILAREVARERTVGPKRPPEAAELAQGERIELEFARNTGDLVAFERHRRWKTPKGRKESLEAVWIIPVVVACGFLYAGYVRFADGRINQDSFVMLATGSVLGLPALAGILELGISSAAGGRVAKQAARDHEASKSGRAPDPFRSYRVTLGPAGFGFRTVLGELRRSWAEVARVKWDRGAIFIHKAATKVEPESIDLMIPPSAFGDPVRAREAFERIEQWHRDARAD